ncbi:MAG: hypothetical protein PWP48_1764 [Clostridiales bacterium]|jgi:uncharacterized membrane protein YcaP (DUF421 family)|nr:hypothetical protein [Clostridiales bacterium]MDK2992531.1 hypothetical protein [Clostridiales bacterium]
MKMIAEIIIQTVMAFFAILIFTRLLGKQQVAELTYYDYINGITFGSIAGVMATDISQRTRQHLIGLALFALLTFLMSYISMKSRPARKVLEGEPTIVVLNGQILENNLRKMHYNIDDLTSELRQKDIFNLNDIKYAILEPSGSLSILKKADTKPLTPKDMNISPQQQSLPSELIVDGQIIYQNLSQNNLNGKWLMDMLAAHDIHSIKEVAYASIDPLTKEFYVDTYKDSVPKNIDISDVYKGKLE